ncbi:MAG: glucosaminidase domain-containing protein [Bacteroidetes bacterium]|nr:glucosaminidase domain-containing protein [Bacteroidota bacterium]
MKKFYIFILTFFILPLAFSQTKDELVEKYVSKYSDISIKEMKKSGVPASITMAQGLLESAYGKSRLAVSANNHFGIKCKRTWKGKTIKHDDDSAQECFRSYDSAEESYTDHSCFLRDNSRYAFLFDYDPYDYESWAHGLKKAGYATNPKYAYLLIDLIERYNLSNLDKGNAVILKDKDIPKATTVVIQEKHIPTRSEVEQQQIRKAVYTYGGLKVYKNNGVDYVLTVDGDTYYSLSRRLGMSSKRLSRLNDTYADAKVGDVVYIRAKSSKAEKKSTVHIVKSGDNLYNISQKYAVKLKKLTRRNGKKANDELSIGERIRLR